MVKFTTTIHRFDSQGEKTGWTYIEIPSDLIEKLKPGNKKSFRVKGQLDQFKIAGMAVMPIGGGRFILTLNASIRKGIGKKKGAMLDVQLTEDKAAFKFNKDFLICLKDDESAESFFKTLAPGHQRYFSKWIDDARTEPTRTKRIAMAINALAKKWGYGEMIRAGYAKNQ